MIAGPCLSCFLRAGAVCAEVFSAAAGSVFVSFSCCFGGLLRVLLVFVAAALDYILSAVFVSAVVFSVLCLLVLCVYMCISLCIVVVVSAIVNPIRNSHKSPIKSSFLTS